MAVAVDHDCPQRETAAARLGAERRRLFVVGTIVSLASPLLPYLTGAWETTWFALAAMPLPLAVRTVVFLLGFHVVIAAIALPSTKAGMIVVASDCRQSSVSDT